MKNKGKTQGSQPTSDKKGLLGQVAEEAKEKLNITPQTVTDALVKDAKQAVNYEVRRGFRDIISGLFKR